MSASKPTTESKRPLSPHLSVYKPQMTSVLSILHRVTGVALVAGTLLIVAILVSAAMGEGAYTTVMGYVSSSIGQLLMLGWSFSLIFHTLNGIRHLIWDTGRLLKIQDATKAGYVVLFGAVILTAGVWVCANCDAHLNGSAATSFDGENLPPLETTE